MATTNVNPPSYASAGKNIVGLPERTAYDSGKDSNGVPINYAQDVKVYEADAALTEGQIVALVGPDPDGIGTGLSAPLRVKPAVATDVDRLVVGAVVKGGAAGEPVTVACDIAYALIDDGESGAVGEGHAIGGTAGRLNAGAALAAEGHCAVNVGGAALVDFYGSGGDAVLVRFL